jgi:hypothetical protein
VTEEPDERQPPRLQDTTERDALPLPLPASGSEEGDTAVVLPAEEPAPIPETVAEEPAPGDEPAPVEEPEPDPAPVENPAPVDPPEPEPEPEAEPEPVEEPEPAPEPPPAAAGNGSGEHDAGLPPFEPAPSVAGLAGGEDEGLPAEVLIGAAFLGGVALAFLIKRLGS